MYEGIYEPKGSGEEVISVLSNRRRVSRGPSDVSYYICGGRSRRFFFYKLILCVSYLCSMSAASAAERGPSLGRKALTELNATRMLNDSPFEFESISRAMDKLQRKNSSRAPIQQPKNIKFPSYPKKTFLQVLEESYDNPKPRFVQIHHRPSEYSSWFLQITDKGRNVGVTNEMLKKESLFELRRQIFNRNYFIIENIVSCMCLCLDASGQLYTNNVEFAQKNGECLFNIPAPWYTSDLYTISSVQYSNSSHFFALGWGASFQGSSLPWSSLEDQRDLPNAFKFMFLPVPFKDLLSIMEIDLILQTYKVNKRLFEYCPALLKSSAGSSSDRAPKKKKTCSIKETFLSSDIVVKRKCRRKKRRSCIKASVSKGGSKASAKARCAKRYKLKECEVLVTHGARNWKRSYVRVVKKSCSCVYKKWPRASKNIMLHLMKSNPCNLSPRSRIN